MDGRGCQHWEKPAWGSRGCFVSCVHERASVDLTERVRVSKNQLNSCVCVKKVKISEHLKTHWRTVLLLPVSVCRFTQQVLELRTIQEGLFIIWR